ncbi:MAG TPA: hypothetical protein PLD84_15645, partial [Chitinophagales bacterium]|nr:hypothetical protein [Chitinophagales bacterium]
KPNKRPILSRVAGRKEKVISKQPVDDFDQIGGVHLLRVFLLDLRHHLPEVSDINARQLILQHANILQVQFGYLHDGFENLSGINGPAARNELP